MPDPARREQLLTWLFRVTIEPARSDGSLYGNSGDLLAVARWLPPEHPPSGVSVFSLKGIAAAPFRLRSGVRKVIRFGRETRRLRDDVAGGPHWYLAGIGVEPAQQGRGLGGVVMAPGLDGSDLDGRPAVLVSANRRNHSFYERHGFVVVEERPIRGGGPPLWAMVRQPRADAQPAAD